MSCENTRRITLAWVAYDNERYEICRTYFLRPGVYCRLILFLPRRKRNEKGKGLALLVYNAIDGIKFFARG